MAALLSDRWCRPFSVASGPPLGAPGSPGSDSPSARSRVSSRLLLKQVGWAVAFAGGWAVRSGPALDGGGSRLGPFQAAGAASWWR
jgi:hypothetical protein